MVAQTISTETVIDSPPSPPSLFPDEPLAQSVMVRLDLDALPPNEALRSDPPSADLCRLVAQFGVLVPLLCLRHADGSLQVQDGCRRVKAARLAGQRDIPAIVHAQGWVNPDAVTLLANAARSSNERAELAAIERLHLAGYSEQQITQATGISAATQRSRLALGHLVPALRVAFDLGRMKATTALAASRLAPAQQERLVSVLRADPTADLTMSQVKAARSVQVARAILSLDAGLFATPNAQPAQMAPWQTRVLALLHDARALVPPAQHAAVEALADAVRIVGEGTGEGD